MSLLDYIAMELVWEKFYEYKQSLACPKQFTKELRKYIDDKAYLSVYESIQKGDDFPVPEKSVISKMSSEKKRVVYTYPAAENTVLKLITWLMLREYDDLFSEGLFSFRPGHTAKDAMRRLLKVKELDCYHAYKVDIHDYFNSVPIEMLLPRLEEVLQEDPELYNFLKALLTQPFVRDRGKLVTEKKGIMAGTPISSFYANLFLKDLDQYFMEKEVIYTRYSDDILVLAKEKEALEEYVAYIREFLQAHQLEVNPAKECFFTPNEGFQFVGFSYQDGRVDIAPATIKKLKQKMRRKRDALARWCKRNDMEGSSGAKAFIRVFNRKLLESPRDNELSWSSWFFPVINQTESLHEIDLYAQECIRYLVSGKHTKARFNVRYEDLKKLGYKSLVHEYYAYRKQEQKD